MFSPEAPPNPQEIATFQGTPPQPWQQEADFVIFNIETRDSSLSSEDHLPRRNNMTLLTPNDGQVPTSQEGNLCSVPAGL